MHGEPCSGKRRICSPTYRLWKEFTLSNLSTINERTPKKSTFRFCMHNYCGDSARGHYERSSGAAQRHGCFIGSNWSTVPLKSKLPPSRETRFSSRETRLSSRETRHSSLETRVSSRETRVSSRERLKNTVSINACCSREIKTSVVKLRTRCREAS